MQIAYPNQALTARTWADIYFDRLESNYRSLRRAMPGQKFMGMVKANGYGHGAIEISRQLESLGAEYLAVACLNEAMELRQAGITLPVLILGYTEPRFAPLLAEQALAQTIYDVDMARQMSEAMRGCGRRLRCHLKLDTGMSRLGLLCDECSIERQIETIHDLLLLPGLEFEGLFTHFSDADGSAGYTHLQLQRFRQVSEAFPSRFALRHAAASAAVLNFPAEAGFDMVRPGILLYGHHPDESTRSLLEVQPVMELKTRVASLKEMPAGSAISYNRTHILSRDSRIAVVPIGYGDGLPRLLSGRQEMLLRGRRVPQIGRVCMDLCMLDVTDCEAAIGDEVTVFGASLPLEEKAAAIGTISYELMCGLNTRVPRIYHG